MRQRRDTAVRLGQQRIQRRQLNGPGLGYRHLQFIEQARQPLAKLQIPRLAAQRRGGLPMPVSVEAAADS